MGLKLYECDVGIKVGGVSYTFSNVRSVEVEDPERNNLTRGANATDKVGLPYKDGLTEPKRMTMPVMELTKEFKDLLDDCFDKQTRIEVFAISRRTGDNKFLKNAMIANRPQQLTLDESPESMDVSLEFISFDSFEKYRE